MRTITVHASQEYDIYIENGILDACGTILKEATKAQKTAVITDDTVDALYSARVTESLEAAGFEVFKFVFPHGEPSKCSATLNQIYDFLCENSITRTDCLVALGGGVVGDITGFAAATFLRGMDFVQIPTTLLAQVDSSVGGKTAIDLPGGKNLVGAFKQPVCVICDPETLRTLPAEIFSDGMGEVIKYGMIRDAALFDQIAAHDQESITAILEDVIAACISIKRDVVEADEFDTGERMILNFGHTLGHAIESYYHYETYSHGSAVAAGMCMMAAKTCTPEVTERLKKCVQAYNLPTEVPVEMKELVPLCGKDKKRAASQLRFIVCKTIGRAEIHTMPFDSFSLWMEA
ncbi:MAG: 3-dehydroquinate synthase [Ruminococcus sp.]|nr:3-dehydroquinate synthase [Ruminococcus sp.]